MKTLNERNADLFEKLAVTLLAGAFIAPVPLYARGLLVVAATVFYILMAMVTLTDQAKRGSEDEDDNRS